MNVSFHSSFSNREDSCEQSQEETLWQRRFCDYSLKYLSVSPSGSRTIYLRRTKPTGMLLPTQGLHRLSLKPGPPTVASALFKVKTPRKDWRNLHLKHTDPWYFRPGSLPRTMKEHTSPQTHICTRRGFPLPSKVPVERGSEEGKPVHVLCID